MTDLELLVASLESKKARQHLGAALTSQKMIGVRLGGDLSLALSEVPPSEHSSDRAIAALETAASTIPVELDALGRRKRLCFGGSIVMSVALVAVVLWVVFGPDPAPTVVMKFNLLAPLVPLIGGGALFKYYARLSSEARDLRSDLVKITRLIRSLRVAASNRKTVDVGIR